MILVIAALGAGCRSDRPGEAQEIVPAMKLEGVRFRVYREATQRASGQASAATFRRDTQGFDARDLLVDLETDQGDVVRIQAPEGRGDLARRTFDVSGGVVATRGADTVRTDRAWYVPTPGRGEGLVSGDRPVVLDGDGYRLTGNGFTYDPALEEIVLHDGARLDAGLEADR